jgi:hypothetical protein
LLRIPADEVFLQNVSGKYESDKNKMKIFKGLISKVFGQQHEYLIIYFSTGGNSKYPQPFPVYFLFSTLMLCHRDNIHKEKFLNTNKRKTFLHLFLPSLFIPSSPVLYHAVLCCHKRAINA